MTAFTEDLMSIHTKSSDNRRQQGQVTASEATIAPKFVVSTVSYAGPKLVLPALCGLV